MTDSDLGFKYSLTGKSALGNTNPKELGYSSKFQTLMVWKSGKVSAAIPSQTLTEITVAHGLPYRPAFNAYYSDTLDGEVYQVVSGFPDISFGGVGGETSVQAKSNNYNLVLSVYNNNVAERNVDIYYEIFIQDLTTG